MNYTTFIARRYLFAKKSHNAINIISAISVACITIGAAALIIVLSVFNGFNDLITSHFNAFDPDIKISAVEGKTFIPDNNILTEIQNLNGVVAYSTTIEENVLLKYSDKQFIATIKGVDSNYIKVTGIDTMITAGNFELYQGNQPFAVIGQGIAYYLQIGLKFINPLNIYVLKKDAALTANPMTAVNHDYIFPSGTFSIEQETDAKYFLVPINFAKNLLNDTLSISSIEIKTNPIVNQEKIEKALQRIVGQNFDVKDRFKQKELYYRIMKYERWAIFLILGFILIIASFNVVGSLAVLIIEKKKDIYVLNSLGANKKKISNIFKIEGLMISVFGGFVGLILGLIICWVQMKFGIVQLSGSGSFIIDAYPVVIKLSDVFLVFFTVFSIGYLASMFTVKYMIKQYLNPMKK